MFGFKKRITPEEFGCTVNQWANEFLAVDACRSLATLFDGWLSSGIGQQFLGRNGISVAKQMLYLHLFTHCAVQAASTQFSQDTGRAITQGAIESFANTPEGYNFGTTYMTLEAVYRGRHKFDPSIERLSNPDYYWPLLPYPNAETPNT